jgi:hypothetical protein
MLTKSEMTKLNTLFAKADSSQMKEISQMFNMQFKAKTQMAKNAFNVGQNVFFNDKRGAKIEGVVTKVMIKNIQVTTDSGMWRVAPTLLKAA